MVYFDLNLHHSAGNDQYVYHKVCTLRSVDLIHEWITEFNACLYYTVRRQVMCIAHVTDVKALVQIIMYLYTASKSKHRLTIFLDIDGEAFLA